MPRLGPLVQEDVAHYVLLFLPLASLCRQAFVSRASQQLIWDHLSYHRTHLTGPTGIPGDTFCSLLKRMGKLEACDISKCWRLTNGDVTQLGSHAEHLTRLDISGLDHVATGALDMLLRQCSKLRHLQADDSLVQSSTLLCLADSCPQLQGLSIKGILLHDDGLAPLVSLAPQLRHLGVTPHCENEGHFTMQLVALLQQATQLETLELSGVYRGEPEGNLNAAILRALHQSCTSTLRHLSIAGNRSQDLVNPIYQLVTSCHALEVLDISQLQETTYTKLSGLGVSSSSLKAVRMEPMFSSTSPFQESVFSVVRGWPNLTSLHAVRAVNLSAAPVPMALIAESCPSLTHLNITAGGGPSTQKASRGKLTDEHLNILASLRDLKHLGIGGYPGISDVGLQLLVEELPGLVKLNISCSACTPAMLRTILQRCGHLELLDISRCPALALAVLPTLTSPRLRHLIAHDLPWELPPEIVVGPPHPCPMTSVRCIDLEYCWVKCPSPALPVATVLGHFPEVESLCLNTWDIGIDTFSGLPAACPKLTFLRLNDCLSISIQALTAAVRASKKLEQLHMFKCQRLVIAAIRTFCHERAIHLVDFRIHSYKSILDPDFGV